MDRISVKILKYLKKENKAVSRETIVDLFGKGANKSLEYLEKEDYIQEGREYIEMLLRDINHRQRYDYRRNSMFEITSEGLDFLEHKPGRDFDHWINRISVICAILGGALLSKPLWVLLEWLWDFLCALF